MTESLSGQSFCLLQVLFLKSCHLSNVHTTYSTFCLYPCVTSLISVVLGYVGIRSPCFVLTSTVSTQVSLPTNRPRLGYPSRRGDLGDGFRRWVDSYEGDPIWSDLGQPPPWTSPYLVRSRLSLYWSRVCEFTHSLRDSHCRIFCLRLTQVPLLLVRKVLDGSGPNLSYTVETTQTSCLNPNTPTTLRPLRSVSVWDGPELPVQK